MNHVEAFFRKTLVQKGLIADVVSFSEGGTCVLLWAYRIRLYSNDFAECESRSISISKRSSKDVTLQERRERKRGKENIDMEPSKQPFTLVLSLIRSDPVKRVALRLAMIACMESKEMQSRKDIPSSPFDEVVDNYLPSFCKQMAVPLRNFQNVVFNKALPLEEGEVLGVDFEGDPTPKLVQIACKSGVMFFRPSDPICLSILSTPKYIHAIFGSHECKYVANPFDIQIEVRRVLPLPFGTNDWSLGDCFQMVVGSQTRGLKQKSDPTCIHRRVEWGDALTEEMVEYARRDAIAHLMIGTEIKRF